MKENTITIDLQEYRDLKALEYKYNRLKRDYENAIKDRRHTYVIHEHLSYGTGYYKTIYSGEEAVINISKTLEASIESNRYLKKEFKKFIGNRSFLFFKKIPKYLKYNLGL